MKLLETKDNREYLVRYGRNKGLRLTVSRSEPSVAKAWAGFVLTNHRRQNHSNFGPAIRSFQNGICIRSYYAIIGHIFRNLEASVGIKTLDKYPWFASDVDEMIWLNLLDRHRSD